MWINANPGILFTLLHKQINYDRSICVLSGARWFIRSDCGLVTIDTGFESWPGRMFVIVDVCAYTVLQHGQKCGVRIAVYDISARLCLNSV